MKKANYFLMKILYEIGRSPPISSVWGMMRKMKGVRREWQYPVLKAGEETAITNEDKAQ